MVTETSTKRSAVPRDPLFVAVVQHLYTCRTFCEDYYERSDITSCVQDYILSSARDPLTIWGEGGCGKSSIMANAYSRVRQLLSSRSILYIILG